MLPSSKNYLLCHTLSTIPYLMLLLKKFLSERICAKVRNPNIHLQSIDLQQKFHDLLTKMDTIQRQSRDQNLRNSLTQLVFQTSPTPRLPYLNLSPQCLPYPVFHLAHYTWILMTQLKPLLKLTLISITPK